MSLIDLDALYVVSDLHLGGEEGFQIFDQGPALASVIDQLGRMEPGKRIALCLNGDIVDFLARPRPGYLDIDDALKNLERTFVLPAFSPVWAALSRFVQAQNRLLVIVLGNHDVELAAPELQHRLRTQLAGTNDAASGRILFATDGTGFACNVGGARTLCVHGNEVDLGISSISPRCGA